MAIIPIVLLACSKSDDTGIDPKDDDPPTEEVTLPYFTDFKDAAIKDGGAYFESKGLKFFHSKIREMSTLQWLDCVDPDGTIINPSRLNYDEAIGLNITGIGLMSDLRPFSAINRISVRILNNCGAPQCTRISTCDENGLVADLYHSSINHDTTFVLDIGSKKLSYLYIGCGEGGVKSISIE